MSRAMADRAQRRRYFDGFIHLAYFLRKPAHRRPRRQKLSRR
jgi:hypothetical protein